MLQRCQVWQCPALHRASSLSHCLIRLARAAAQLPPHPSSPAARPAAPPALAPSAAAAAATAAPVATPVRRADALWEELLRTSAHAHALRETDTLYAVVQCLLVKGYFPPALSDWPTLAYRVLCYSDVESCAVWHFPGLPEAHWRASELRRGVESAPPPPPPDGDLLAVHGGRREVGCESGYDAGYRVYPSRETLCMTGGVVPLSGRVGCADGQAMALLLTRFEWHLQSTACDAGTRARVLALWEMSRVLVHVLRSHAPHVRMPSLLTPLRVFMRRLRTEERCAAEKQREYLSTEPPPPQPQQHQQQSEQITDVLRVPSSTVSLLSVSSESAIGTVTTTAAAAMPKEPTLGTQRKRSASFLWLPFVHDLCACVTRGAAFGARVVLDYLAHAYRETEGMCPTETRVPDRVTGDGISRSSDTVGHIAHRASLQVVEERLLLRAVRVSVSAFVSFYHHAPHRTSSSTAQDEPPGEDAPHREGAGAEDCDVDESVGCAGLLQAIYSAIDVLFQRNANAGNPLRLSADIRESIRAEVGVALLRARRLESASPDRFLRAAMPVVDRCQPTLAMEAELIAGKVALLDYLRLDESSREVLYRDLIASLRTLVELRPERHDLTHMMSGSHVAELDLYEDAEKCDGTAPSNPPDGHISDRTNNSSGRGEGNHKDATANCGLDINCRTSCSSEDANDTDRRAAVGSEDDIVIDALTDSCECVWHAPRTDTLPAAAAIQVRLCVAPPSVSSQTLVHEAHQRVCTALCRSPHETHWHEAYQLLVIHKHHGLRITRELIHPVMDVLARRGDCRVFNLVDSCVLYSNSVVDMTTMTHLFRACAVAGDYYRARALMDVCQSVMPGCLARASAELRGLWRELKLIDAVPLHLFTTEEEDIVHAALHSGAGGGGGHNGMAGGAVGGWGAAAALRALGTTTATTALPDPLPASRTVGGESVRGRGGGRSDGGGAGRVS